MSDAALARLEGVCSRLEALEIRLTGGAPSASGGVASAAGGSAEAPFVKAFDDLLSAFFSPVETNAKACGADVEKIVCAYKEALTAQRAMLVIAGNNKKPDSGKLQDVLKPTASAMVATRHIMQLVANVHSEKVEGLKDRRSKQFNHLAMVAEGAACLQWVCIEPTPAPYLSDIIPGSEMYANKVIMEFKGKDDTQVSFAKDFKTFLVELQKYVKAHHTTGLAWNPRGGSDYTAGAASAPKAAAPPPPPAGGPPPPPPPPPAGFFDDVKKNAAAPAPSGGAAALFAEINAKGAGGVTSGLKKVSKDQMTHKNPALRASSVVPDKADSGAKAGPVVKSVVKKAPKIEQQGSKWFIENHENNRDLQVTDGNAKTAICLVQCTKSLLQVANKVNTIQIDSCVKTSVVVESCVASVDIINCKSVEVQITDWTPMITIDGCAGVIVYLSQRCLDDDISIITSKSSELNIVLPAQTDQDDPVEIPVPEQFETKIRNGKLETTCVAHVGA